MVARGCLLPLLLLKGEIIKAKWQRPLKKRKEEFCLVGNYQAFFSSCFTYNLTQAERQVNQAYQLQIVTLLALLFSDRFKMQEIPPPSALFYLLLEVDIKCSLQETAEML